MNNKSLKILTVGNSFGEDATRYLYGVARAAGDEVKIAMLFIGGCSLYRHYRNMLSEERAYAYQINGMHSGLHVSLKEALLSDEWDFVVTQQCSPDSGSIETYYPYVTVLADYVLSGQSYTGIEVNAAQFRKFYQTFLYSAYSGNAAITEEEQSAFRAQGDDADVVMRFTFDVDGKEVTYVYRCYNYSARQTFMTKNSNGSFYILQSQVQKIINDLGRVFSTAAEDVIDPTGRDH